MKANIPLDILLFILGMFFYGVRNMVAKWMVVQTGKLLKRLFRVTEHELAIYIHYRNRAYHKHRQSK